jgi:16S rRNA (uracil1498-N3)-methyltransferase
MSNAWFYLPALAAAGESLQLTGEEAHHAASVRRLRAGDAVTLFDGHGNLAQARITAINARGREIALAVGERAKQPPPRPKVQLCCALPKGERLATLLDMATQLGMTSFTPLRCVHGVVQPSENLIARSQRICLEACKQSRRAWLPELRAAVTPAEAATQAAARGELVLVAHPGGDALSSMGTNEDRAVTILIGPEGGFAETELAAMLTTGAKRFSLGDAILRIETAAVAALAAIRLKMN